jgi:hypothetical protein
MAPTVVNGAAEVHETADVSAVQKWIQDQKSKGDMGESAAIQAATSLTQMASMVAEGEPKDAKAVLSAMDRLCERWARKNSNKKPGTARAYAARAKNAIEEYLRWAAAPDKYDPKRGRPRSNEPKKPPEKKVATETQSMVTPPMVNMPPPPPANQATFGGVGVQEVRLGKGREPFRYILPAEGFVIADAMRVAYALIANCDDYDPKMTPNQAFSSALQRSERGD